MTNTTAVDLNSLAGGNCNLCGTPVTNQFSSIGIAFNNPSYPNEDTADYNLTPYVPGVSGNMLFVYQGGLIGDPTAQPFQINFTVPVTAVGFTFAASMDAYLQLSAYSGTTLLETEDFVGTSAPIGLSGFAGLIETSDITTLDVSYLNAQDPTRTLNFSLANVLFVDPPATPEPSTLVLMGAGLLGMGVVARARLRSRQRG